MRQSLKHSDTSLESGTLVELDVQIFPPEPHTIVLDRSKPEVIVESLPSYKLQSHN